MGEQKIHKYQLIVSKTGVHFKGRYYGQYNIELLAYQGKMVQLSYDPDDLQKVYLYDAVTFKLITIAKQNQLIPYGTVTEESLRNTMRESRIFRRAAKQMQKC